MDALVNFELRRAREVFRGVYLTAAGNVVSIYPWWFVKRSDVIKLAPVILALYCLRFVSTV
jgi:hypothetical protein